MKKTILAIALSSLLTSCGQKNAEQHLEAGKKLLDNNQVNAAIIEFKNALQMNPDDYSTRIILGEAYLSIGNASSAEKELFKANQIKSLDQESNFLLLKSLSLQNKHEEIIEYFEGLVLESELANILLAKSYYSVGKDAQANLIIEGISNNLDSKFTGYAKTLQQAKEGSYKKALRLIIDFNANNPSESSRVLESQLAFNVGDFERSITILRELKNEKPAHLPYHLMLANSLVKNENYQEATPLVKALLKNFPRNPFINQLQAIISFQNRDFEQALLSAEKAIDLPGGQATTSRFIAGVSAYHL
jgi:Flp pilus assembly protein TadD